MLTNLLMAESAKVDVVVVADFQFTAYLGNKKITGQGATAKTLSMNLPPGMHPLFIFPKNTNGNRGVLASVSVDGKPTYYTNGISGFWVARQDSEIGYNPIKTSCPRDKYNSYFDSFLKAGGNPKAEMIWPGECSSASESSAVILRYIYIGGQSATARKVEFAIAADYYLPNAHVGSYTTKIPDELRSAEVLRFSLYLEPGSYPFRARVINKANQRGFAAVVSIDNNDIAKTDGSGHWLATDDEDLKKSMSKITSECSTHADMKANIKAGSPVEPGVIWPGGCNGGVKNTALFYTQLHIPAKDPQNLKKVDFTFFADNQMEMSMNNHSVISTMRFLAMNNDGSVDQAQLGLRDDPDKGLFFITDFSLMLKPGKHTFKFHAESYGGFRGLIGAITEDGKLLALTKPDNRFKMGTSAAQLGPVTDKCSIDHLERHKYRQKRISEFRKIQETADWIWPGGCEGANGKSEAFFEVDIDVGGSTESVPAPAPVPDNKDPKDSIFIPGISGFAGAKANSVAASEASVIEGNTGAMQFGGSQAKASAIASASSGAGAMGSNGNGYGPLNGMQSNSNSYASASANSASATGSSQGSNGMPFDNSQASASAHASASAESSAIAGVFSQAASKVFRGKNGKRSVCMCQEL